MKMSLVIEAYKERIIDMYKARYGDKLNLKVLEKKLDKIIDTRLQNPKATLVNNYINQCKRCNITEIADLVITGFNPHPVFKMVMEESDKSIIRLTISENSDLANNTLGDLLLVNRTGMRVIAIRRGSSWIYGPDKRTMLLPADTLILKGTDEGADLLEKLAAGTCSLEDIPEELEDED